MKSIAVYVCHGIFAIFMSVALSRALHMLIIEPEPALCGLGTLPSHRCSCVSRPVAERTDKYRCWASSFVLLNNFVDIWASLIQRFNEEIEGDAPAAAAFKAEMDLKIADLKQQAEQLTGKDNKKAREPFFVGSGLPQGPFP